MVQHQGNSRPGSSVSIVNGYRLDGPGIKSRRKQDYPHLFRPALGPTKPPVQCVLGVSWGVKSGREVTLTPHPFLVLWSRKSRAIPLLPLWAVWPVQSLSACTRVTFTFLPLSGKHMSNTGQKILLHFTLKPPTVKANYLLQIITVT
jgi:hypothetical protein